MSKIPASSLIVDDDELEFRDADAQKKINKILEEKLDKTSIVHTTGAAEDKVMSQKAVTEKFESYGITVVDGYLCMEV